MADSHDKDEYLAYAEHCERMAESATEQADKTLWLRMAAAWRRECAKPPHIKSADPAIDS
jgi:hypothetical protein